MIRYLLTTEATRLIYVDDHEFDIRIRDELIHSIWNGSWLRHVTIGVHTREKMIVRQELHISSSFCVWYMIYYRESLDVDA